MIFGEEHLFKTDCLSMEESYHQFFLRYIGTDPDGLKMSGQVPQLWKYYKDCVIGPEICDEDDLYRVNKVDYDKETVWLQKILF